MKIDRLDQFAEAPVHRTVLPNGLTVVTAQTGSRFAHANLVLRVGAIEDTRPGMAHMLEHLVCHGDALDGVHPHVRPLLVGGADTNAMTNFVSTEYFFDTYTQKLPDAIPVLLKMVFEADLSARAVDAERGPICAEIKQRNHEDRFGRWFRRHLVPHRPSFHQSVGGTAESVRAMTVEEIRAHYARYYNASNAALVVTGGVDHEHVLSMIAEAELPTGAENPVRPEEQACFGQFVYTERDRPPGVAIYFPKPEDEQNSELLQFALDYLTGTRFAPVMQKMRYADERIYSSWGAVTGGFASRALIEVSIEPKYFDYAVNTLFELIEQFQSAQINEEAWFANVNKRRRQKITGMEVFSEPSSYGDWNRLLSECWLEDDWEVIDRLAFLDAVTPMDAAEVAKRFLKRDVFGMIFVDPES